MYSRRDLVEIFSTFLRLDGDRARGWQVDPSLQRSMTRSIAQLKTQTEKPAIALQFWIFYWQRFWQQQPSSRTGRLAEGHISAYLQETCYRVARKIRAALEISVGAGVSNLNYQVCDCFQIAIVQIPKILKGYNPERSTSLDDYARVVFRTHLQEVLRSAKEADLCSDWALLRKLSKRGLREALEQGGASQAEIARYQQAWTCFKTLYHPTRASATRSLNAPDRATWEAIAAAYSRDRPFTPVPPETLEIWLRECARLARIRLYPPQTSLNQTRSPTESGETLDRLPATLDASLLETWIESEETTQRQQQQQVLNRFLNEAMAALDPQSQAILQLYYQQGLMQTQIAEQLNLKQYQVSRQLARARGSLLKALVQWSQTTFNIALSSSAIATLGDTLEEWLQGDGTKNADNG